MARRLDDDLDPVRPSSGKDSRAKGRARDQSRVPWWRISAWTFIGLVVFATGLYAWQQTEKFVIVDSRFALNGTDGAEDGTDLSVTGVSYASLNAVKSVFRDDLGKSTYLVSLADRRNEVRKLNWVKDATIARLWPNRISVRVVERMPVAFVPLEKNGYQLIDDEGFLLPAVAARFRLPVLRGVDAAATQPQRKERVRRMLKVLDDIGSNVAGDLSEVDVSDTDNIKLTQPSAERILTLLMGDRNFAARYQNFRQHLAEIQRRLPGAATLDLRLEDRITVVE